MTYTPAQRYLAEFLGTFGILAAITGGALFSLNLPLGSADEWSRVLLISFCVGFALLGMIQALGDVSGGHFNPAVTVAMAVRRALSPKDAVAYILAQAAGGVVGVATVAGVAYGSGTLWAKAQLVAFAAQGYSGNGSTYGVGVASVFLLEVALTFLLVLVVLLSTRPESSARNLAPLGIALTLAMVNMAGIPIDGASVNPARSFAPALLSSWFASDRWAIQQDWLFWVAPIVGGLIAAAVDLALRPKA